MYNSNVSKQPGWLWVEIQQKVTAELGLPDLPCPSRPQVPLQPLEEYVRFWREQT